MHPAHIHVTGASGSGVTTLGSALARKLEIATFNTDDFFWMPSDPPYQAKRPMPERLLLLHDAISAERRFVLSGSLDGWGDSLVEVFDLVIWLYVPTEIRLQRLQRRERERFGAAIDDGGPMSATHNAFLAWAASYDSEQCARSLVRHVEWLSKLSCKVLRLDGTRSVESLVSSALA